MNFIVVTTVVNEKKGRIRILHRSMYIVLDDLKFSCAARLNIENEGSVQLSRLIFAWCYCYNSAKEGGVSEIRQDL